MHAENELANATTVSKRELNSVESSQEPHEDPIRLKASRSQLLNPVLQTQLLGRGHHESTNLTHFNDKNAMARFQRQLWSVKMMTVTIMEETKTLNLLLSDK